MKRERKLIIPKISPDRHEEIQEGFCSYDDECKDLVCKDCMFVSSNLEHFVRYLQLAELPGEITIKEEVEK
jgi:hypothetical protein